MRSIEFSVGEYYHIYNRSVEDINIFREERDFARFIALILVSQRKGPAVKLARIAGNVWEIIAGMSKHSVFGQRGKKGVDKLLANRDVELIEFCLMPNHFHLILKELQEGGISRFMQKLGNAYSKYFNTKYKRKGHLFAGPFHAVHIDDNDYLLPLSVYIHKNPYKLKGWRGKEEKYPWSSFQDFVNVNRWSKLLNPSIVLEQFDNPEEYKRFVREYDPESKLDPEYLIDID